MKLYQYTALVTRVVDGDTVHCNIDLGFKVHINVIVRLAGINAPELNSTDEDIRLRAKESTLFLSQRVLDKTVNFDSKQLDKYGRSIADIILDGESMSKLMLSKGFAVPYP